MAGGRGIPIVARATTPVTLTFAAMVAVAMVAAACAGSTPADRLTSPPPGVTDLGMSLALAGQGLPNCTPAPLADRAARVLVVGLRGARHAADPIVGELLDVGVGGVLVTHTSVESEAQVRALVSAIQAGSRHPVIVATDEEPGRVTSFASIHGTTPSARRLAAASTHDEVSALARQVGTRLAAVGVTMDLAPVADLDGGPARGLVGDRSFSALPEVASAYARAWAHGLAQAGVTPVTKHFPGHGRATGDTHLGAGEVGATMAELRTSDLVPFVDAIVAGAPVVMMAHATYTAIDADLPASMSPRAYELLRDLGFEGVAMTDSIGMGAINLRWDFDEAAVKAVAAGADAVLATDGAQARRMRDALVSAVQRGELAETRLDQAAARMAELAGADPVAVACREVRLPRLDLRRGAGP